MQTFSLYKFQYFIKKVMALNFDQKVQVTAELAKLNESKGHTYIELVEKSDLNDKVIAKAQAVLWRNTKSKLQQKHGKLLQDILKEGVEVSLSVFIEYHELYGLKFQVVDIDPSYTIGSFASKRSKILEFLMKKQLVNKNASLNTPTVIQNIAVISSESAAGYADFMSSLQTNSFQFKFETTLFPASMQGNDVEKDVCTQIDKIHDDKLQYDIVVIIRGGGSRVDLSYFDNLKIAERIANAELPVYAGIGHQIDESVTEIVAHSSFKTPTAVAEAIIYHNAQFLGFLQEYAQRFQHITQSFFQKEKSYQEQRIVELRYLTQSKIQGEMNRFGEYRQKLLYSTQFGLERHQNKLEKIKSRFEYANPIAVLYKGYALVEQEGKRIQSIKDWKTTSETRIQLQDGNITIKNYESK